MTERFALAFPADGKHLRLLRMWCRLCLAHSLLGKSRESLILALSEACANNIKHCRGGDSRAEVRVEFDVAKDRVTARVRNFCLAAVAHRIKSRDLKDVRPGGLGMRFIEESVDRVSYEKEGDGFLTLVMTKKRRSRGG